MTQIRQKITQNILNPDFTFNINLNVYIQDQTYVNCPGAFQILGFFDYALDYRGVYGRYTQEK